MARERRAPSNTRLQRTRLRSPLKRNPLGRAKAPYCFVFGLAAVAALSGCIPYRPIPLTHPLPPSSRTRSFFVEDGKCWAAAYTAEQIRPWLLKWSPGASLAPTSDQADVVIRYEPEPCVICVDCVAQPPRAARALLRFRNGARVEWVSTQPQFCAARDCLPPMLAKAIARMWEPHG